MFNLNTFPADGEGIGEYNPGDNKRSKGLGIGGPDGPVSLDDVRRLQRSNEVICYFFKQDLFYYECDNLYALCW